MNLRNKIAVITGSVILAGSLAGVALAANETNADPSAPAASAQAGTPRFDLQQAVEDRKLTQEQADLLTQIQTLRQSALEKLQADINALVDQAVTEGKITQEQGDQMLQHKGMPGGGHLGHGGFGKGPGMWGRHLGFPGMTQDELKAKLDAQVEAGTITQEQADEILQRFAEREAHRADRLQTAKSEIEESQTEAK